MTDTTDVNLTQTNTDKWNIENYPDVSQISTAVNDATHVVETILQSINVDTYDDIEASVETVRTIVQALNRKIMTCQLYHANTRDQYGAMAYIANELRDALWNFHGSILASRMKLHDKRRKVMRQKNMSQDEKEFCNSICMISMFMTSFETMVTSTITTVEAAFNWHQHLEMMSEQFNITTPEEEQDLLEEAEIDEICDNMMKAAPKSAVDV